MSKLNDFLKNSFLLSLLISTLAGVVGGYVFDHIKHIDSVKTDQAIKTLSDFDDLDEPIIKFGTAIARQQGIENASQALRMSLAKQMAQTDNLSLVFPDSAVGNASQKYKIALQQMTNHLNIKNQEEFTAWENDVNDVADAQKLLKRKVLSEVGL